MLTATLLSILLISALAGVQQCSVASAQSFEAVTIKADGSVEPSTAPISRNGSVYTLTEDIQGNITVEKSSITLDGAVHTVENISLNNITGVTIRNFIITAVASDTSALSSSGIFMHYTTNTFIENNTVSQKKYGIHSSSFGCAGIRIAGNTVTDNQYGIHVEGYNYTIIGNNISANSLGTYLYYGFNSTVFGNHIAENGIGIRFFVGFYGHSGDGNLVYSNNFVNNSKNVENVGPLFTLAIGPMNAWDSGGAGNYWRDYAGTDTDGDGIGDTPYVIDDLNQDNFPLMTSLLLPELPGTPSVTLFSPRNETYAVAEVELNFTVSKRVVWIGYSLDGQDNVTVAGNVTLAGLSDCVHTLTMYAEDTFGDSGSSETITFTVATFPTSQLVAASIGASVTAICLGLIVYFTKRKKKQTPKLSTNH